MLQEISPRLVELLTTLARVQQKISQMGHSDKPEPAPLWLLPAANELENIITNIELPISHLFISEFIQGLGRNGGISRNDLMTLFDRIHSGVRAELETRVLLTIDPESAKYYVPDYPLYGYETWKKFPSIAYEVDEAAKCYALERSTASAFHSIRCLEAGIRALSRCLGIPDPTRASDRNWGAMLKAIKDQIDARWPGSSTRMLGDGEFFDSAYAALAAMQNPWRNATMHLDQKYTPAEARHIFEVVGGFMSKLASRMDEDGQPLA